jgi:hypothetical protein
MNEVRYGTWEAGDGAKTSDSSRPMRLKRAAPIPASEEGFPCV